MKRFFALLLCVFLCAQPAQAACIGELIAYEENTGQTDESTDQESLEGDNTGGEPAKNPGGLTLSAPSAILMEASTGQVIFEKAADEQRPPASVTKVMTLLLIFDALSEGRIHLEEDVTVSEYAASMGGSQVFLEPGETQTVDTMIKCIAVASANDACVAMAEHICGNEEEFVNQMNQRAGGLGMSNTHFVNCNGLDTDGHVTTARDIALMSRELINTYPRIHDYSMIWMENITHTTNKGTSEFGLTNTNKLVRQYQYATGLKTGSTDKAKFCVSATAEKDGMELIAVVMAAPEPKGRFKDATTLLGYGFGKCNKYMEEKAEDIPPVKVVRGVEKTVKARQAQPFVYVDTTGADLNSIERNVQTDPDIKAPVKKGEHIGAVIYSLDGKKIGAVAIEASEDIAEISLKSALKDAFGDLLL